MTKKALSCLCFLAALSIILICCGTQSVTSDPMPAAEGTTAPMVTATTEIPPTEGLATPVVTATTEIPATNVEASHLPVVEKIILEAGRFRVPPAREIECSVSYMGRLPVFLTLADDQRDVFVSEIERSEAIELPAGYVYDHALKNPSYYLYLQDNEAEYAVYVWLTSTDQILLGIPSLGDGCYAIESPALKALLTSLGQNVDLPDDIAEKITKIELTNTRKKIELVLSSEVESVIRRTIRDSERREGEVCCVYIEVRIYTDTEVYYGCMDATYLGVEGVIFDINKKDLSIMYSAFRDDAFSS